jgi:hypothetical protein
LSSRSSRKPEQNQEQHRKNTGTNLKQTGTNPEQTWNKSETNPDPEQIRIKPVTNLEFGTTQNKSRNNQEQI